ncbi:MAG TPA: hypothetical protein VKU36_03575 [Candidatus Babeliales bacterium]|nr:hypothetical protein [Candidatus Babeliales bacterium]
MKKTVAVFMLCALNTSSLFTMQLITRKKDLSRTLLNFGYRNTHYISDSEIKTQLDKKINRLLYGNTAVSIATIAAAGVTNNPYFLIPLIPHIASMVGICIVDLATNNPIDEPKLICDLMFFTQQRKTTIDKFINEYNETNNDIEWLKHAALNEKLLKDMGTKTELLEEYIATLVDRMELKKSYESTFAQVIAPIFNQHHDANLEECLAYNEKKITRLDRARLYKLPSLPLAWLPKSLRQAIYKFDKYGDAWQMLIAFDLAFLGMLTGFAACGFPIHTASTIANMEMAYYNQTFFEQESLDDTKKHLKLITALIKLQQNNLNNKS